MMVVWTLLWHCHRLWTVISVYVSTSFKEMEPWLFWKVRSITFMQLNTSNSINIVAIACCVVAWGIECLKYKASLRLLYPTQSKRGTSCFKQRFKPPFSPEFTLVVFMQGNLASRNEITRLMKNCSRVLLTGKNL